MTDIEVSKWITKEADQGNIVHVKLNNIKNFPQRRGCQKKKRIGHWLKLSQSKILTIILRIFKNVKLQAKRRECT